MSRIRLTIGHLELRGFAPADRAAFVERLQTELRRVLADPATRHAWAHSHKAPVLKLGQVPFVPGPAGGRQLGARVAGAIGRGLKP